MYRSRVAAFSFMALLACAYVATPARAEVKLRVADSFPTGHFVPKFTILSWMAEVTKRSNGEITFEYFPGQQLGKAADMLTLTQTGVANIGYVAPSYISDKMPLSEAAMLPGSFQTSCQGTMGYWTAARGGVIEAQDFAANKIRLLLAVTLTPYQILTVKQPIQSEGDIRGLKLRSSGGAQDMTLRTIGAVPVRMAAPDTYESLSRGTMDGVLFPLDSALAYNLEKIVRYSTEGANFSSFVVTYSVNETTWKNLSSEHRKIMTDVADEVVPAACAAIDGQEVEVRKKLRDSGVQFSPISSEFRGKLDEMLKDVGTSWAKALDARGRKGSEALAEFRNAVQAQSAK